MPRIVVRNLNDLRALQAKFRILKNVLPQLQKLAMDKTANEDVLEEIHREMVANDFSDKIIDATFVGKTEIIGNKIRTHFISNYVADNGFDVSVGREEGTRQSEAIRPKRPDGSLKIRVPGGGNIFRKLSRPSGIERLLIIERTLKRAENSIVAGYKDNLAASVSKFLGV